MNRETLSELGLTKEQMDVVFKEHGKSINSLKERLATAETERNDFQAKLAQTQSDLESKFTNEQKDFAIKYALKDTEAHDKDLVLGMLDRDTINIVDGEVNGLTEQLDALKEKKSFLFKQPEPVIKEELPPRPQIVVDGNPNGGQLGVEQDAFSNITGKYQ